jgi:hypothetical protein
VPGRREMRRTLAFAAIRVKILRNPMTPVFAATD